MPKIRPKDRNKDTSPFSLSSTNGDEICESGQQPLIESYEEQELWGGRNAKSHSRSRGSDSEVGFGRTCVDGSVAAEERRERRSAHRFCRAVSVQRPRDRAGV